MPAVQNDKTLQRTSDSIPVALSLQQISAEASGFAAESEVPPVELLNHMCQLFSPLHFLYFTALSQFILYVSESKSPLGFVETNNDGVSEPIRVPLGLDYAADRAEASQGVKSLRGKKTSDKSESFKQILPLPSPRQNTQVSSVLRWRRNSLLWEISFVVSSSSDSARFGHYSQDLLLRTFAVLSECSC